MCVSILYVFKVQKQKRKCAFILLSLLCEIKVTKQTNLSMKSSASENMCITIVGYISTVDKQMSSIEGEDPHISLCFVDHSLANWQNDGIGRDSIGSGWTFIIN